ncbi:glycosyltransferase [Spirochaetota bacterium]
MKIVLSSRGSRGDVNPIIEIAAEFFKDNHHVSICVPKLFEEITGKRGLKTTFYSEDIENEMQNMESGLKALKRALNWFSKSIEDQFEYMLQETKDADVMITSVNEIAAPTVAEYRNIPHFRIAYTPVLPGYHPPPLIPWQKLPPLANRGMWHVINGLTGLFFKRFLNQKRIKLGMRQIGSVGKYFTENSHTILTLNEILAPPCKSWNNNYMYDYSGYCYGDINGELDRELLNFINGGPPPIYIGFGSVSVKDADAFTRLILKSVSSTGCRIILGSGWTGLGNTSLPHNIFQVNDTHHGTLFPHLAGIVHHGGSGTTHTAARAGIPQFIMPQIADQFFWGHRIHSLGLGPVPVAPKKINEHKLTKAINELINNETYKRNAKTLSEEMFHENGIPSVVEIVTKNIKDELLNVKNNIKKRKTPSEAKVY